MNLKYAGPWSELPLRFSIFGDKVWIHFLGGPKMTFLGSKQLPKIDSASHTSLTHAAIIKGL